VQSKAGAAPPTSDKGAGGEEEGATLPKLQSPAPDPATQHSGGDAGAGTDGAPGLVNGTDSRKFELRSSADEFGGSTSNGSDEGSNEPSAAGGGGGSGGGANQFNEQPTGAGGKPPLPPLGCKSTPPSVPPSAGEEKGARGEEGATGAPKGS
jgi:hypothetical protein